MRAQRGQVAVYLALVLVAITFLVMMNVGTFLGVSARNSTMNAGDAAALDWHLDEGSLHTAAADDDTMIRLYDASGKAVASGRGALSAKLAKGIYVMKAAGQTIKVLAR